MNSGGQNDMKTGHYFTFYAYWFNSYIYSSVSDSGWGLGAFLRWWPPSAMWAGLLIYWLPPPVMALYPLLEEKNYQKITIPILRLVLQNFDIPGCFPYIPFCCYLLLISFFSLVFIVVCGSISVIWSYAMVLIALMQAVYIYIYIYIYIYTYIYMYPDKSLQTLLCNTHFVVCLCIFVSNIAFWSWKKKLIPAWIISCVHYKSGIKSVILYQISTAALLKFGNG